MFDNIGGNELGVLVERRHNGKTCVCTDKPQVKAKWKVFFETMGAGEVMIDDVQIHVWEPANHPPRHR